MNAYTPISLANSDISTRLQRHKVLQLFSHVKTVIFDSSSQLGGQNIPELDSQTSLVDLKIDFAEKAIKVNYEITDIRFTIDEFQRHTEILRNTKFCEILRKLVSVCFRMEKKKTQ